MASPVKAKGESTGAAPFCQGENPLAMRQLRIAIEDSRVPVLEVVLSCWAAGSPLTGNPHIIDQRRSTRYARLDSEEAMGRGSNVP